MDIISKNKEETFQFATKIAETLQGGDILALFGDLGAGKTTFTQGLAVALGVKKNVTSPTFNIVKEYAIDQGQAKKLIHIDAYRLLSAKDAISIGLDEMLDNRDSIIVVEWPERIWDAISARARRIDFTYIDENTRKISY